MSDQLPEGFELDQSALPEGFELDESAPATQEESAPQLSPEETAMKRATRAALPFGMGQLPLEYQDALIRPAVKAAAGIPRLATEAGIGAGNLIRRGLGIEGEDLQSPFGSVDEALDASTQKPLGTLNKGAEFVNTALMGAGLPAGMLSRAQVPANFVKPSQDLVRQATLASSQKAGYVVPPATTNPSTANKILESIGGKAATAQDAALRNQEVTNTLAKRALGLAGDSPVTKEALSTLRTEAGDAYQVLRKVGEVALDDATTKSLDEVAAKFTGSKLKEALGGSNDIPKIVQAIKEEPLTGDTAVDAISLLRDKASVAYAAGDKGLGKAYRQVSGAIENLMERNLTGEALKAFKNARQLIAKTHTVEKALNASTGNVNAVKLAGQLEKDAPLSGDLLTAARFGQAFPKAAAEIVDSGSVRNTDVILGAGTAALSREPSYLMYPFLRQGVRFGLLSDAGQSLATPRAGQIPPGLLMGGLTAEEQARLLAEE